MFFVGRGGGGKWRWTLIKSVWAFRVSTLSRVDAYNFLAFQGGHSFEGGRLFKDGYMITCGSCLPAELLPVFDRVLLLNTSDEKNSDKLTDFYLVTLGRGERHVEIKSRRTLTQRFPLHVSCFTFPNVSHFRRLTPLTQFKAK